MKINYVRLEKQSKYQNLLCNPFCMQIRKRLGFVAARCQQHILPETLLCTIVSSFHFFFCRSVNQYTFR